MKRNLFWLILILAAGSYLSSSWAQIPVKGGFRLQAERMTASTPGNQLLSNSVIDLKPDSLDLLMGTGGGLTIWHSVDSTFSSFDESNGMGHGSVSALGARQGTIWAATAYTANTSVGPLPAGGGVGFSADQGLTWTWFPQPMDPDTVTSYDPTTTNVQNVTYDLLITSTGVWITSWAGGLRKYSFADSAWHLVVPDTLPFSALQHLNHRAFSITGNDSVLWVGTAAGINKSTDGGVTWQNFNHGNTGGGISGNFVTALDLQYWAGDTIVWAATWQADSPNETYGVSVSKDGGQSWQTVLTDTTQTLQSHNFAFSDSVAYVATNLGLYKAHWYHNQDGNLVLSEWGLIPTSQMVDAQSGYTIVDPEVYSALVDFGRLWVGTAQGLAVSPDLGNTWTVLRTNPPVSSSNTYAYPNPFYARLQYFTNFHFEMPASGTLTVKVYDYAMDEVYSKSEQRNAGVGDFQWYAQRSDGRQVATGVYYYSIERGGAKAVWGKVAVIY